MDIISLVLSIWMISLLAFEILAKRQIESKRYQQECQFFFISSVSIFFPYTSNYEKNV